MKMMHEDAITCLSFSSDSKYLASGSWDETFKIWKLGEYDLLLPKNTIVNIAGQTINGPPLHSHAVFSVAFSGNNKYFVSGSGDSTFKVWAIEKDALTLK